MYTIFRIYHSQRKQNYQQFYSIWKRGIFTQVSRLVSYSTPHYSSASSLLSHNTFSFHDLPQHLLTSTAPSLPPSNLLQAQSNTSVILNTTFPSDQTQAAGIGDQNATECVPTDMLFLLVYVVIRPLL